MKRLRFAPALLMAVFAGLGLMSTTAVAAPAAPGGANGDTASVGTQAKPPVEAGKVDAKTGKALGPTNLVKVDEQTSRPSSSAVRADANVGFYNPLNYCSYQLTYTPVYNTSGVTKYFQVVFVNQGQTRYFYGSIAANSTAYPPFYGVLGVYSAYLYVWDGSAYSYDDYRTGTNNCTVAVTAACSPVYPGWVQVTLDNNGTDYATVQTQRLQPTPQVTYYDYPVAGGAVITRWVYVGTGVPYAIAVDVLSSVQNPYYFAGIC